ncbi:hypothetical protein [Amycolatopsis lexingtonensis]|uniref:hypothetical protein n=1 Tax=Amycolatopsis lexingtonensis TaxID=218822 RepID=UPI003F72884F
MKNPYPQQNYPQGPHQQMPPQPGMKVVSKERHKTANGFHLLMTFITFGTWGLFVWAPLLIWRSIFKKKTVTKYVQ